MPLTGAASTLTSSIIAIRTPFRSPRRRSFTDASRYQRIFRSSWAHNTCTSISEAGNLSRHEVPWTTTSLPTLIKTRWLSGPRTCATWRRTLWKRVALSSSTTLNSTSFALPRTVALPSAETSPTGNSWRSAGTWNIEWSSAPAFFSLCTRSSRVGAHSCRLHAGEQHHKDSLNASKHGTARVLPYAKPRLASPKGDRREPWPSTRFPLCPHR